jgi:hypothetical protein
MCITGYVIVRLLSVLVLDDTFIGYSLMHSLLTLRSVGLVQKCSIWSAGYRTLCERSRGNESLSVMHTATNQRHED